MAFFSYSCQVKCPDGFYGAGCLTPCGCKNEGKCYRNEASQLVECNCDNTGYHGDVCSVRGRLPWQYIFALHIFCEIVSDLHVRASSSTINLCAKTFTAFFSRKRNGLQIQVLLVRFLACWLLYDDLSCTLCFMVFFSSLFIKSFGINCQSVV